MKKFQAILLVTMSQEQAPKLIATYTSPDNKSFTLNQDLPALPKPQDLTEKTNFLAALRESITNTQQGINKELTARMEEDKAREAAGGRAVADVDEDKEEENYGEELQEEED